jgi:hypothetical protein
MLNDAAMKNNAIFLTLWQFGAYSPMTAVMPGTGWLLYKKSGLEGRPPNLEDFNENTLHAPGGRYTCNYMLTLIRRSGAGNRCDIVSHADQSSDAM